MQMRFEDLSFEDQKKVRKLQALLKRARDKSIDSDKGSKQRQAAEGVKECHRFKK